MENQQTNKGLSVNINLDKTPVLYTDNVLMSANEDGVVLDFGQKLGTSNQLRIVARIGMSRTHAKKFMAEFSKLIAMSEGHKQTGKKAN